MKTSSDDSLAGWVSPPAQTKYPGAIKMPVVLNNPHWSQDSVSAGPGRHTVLFTCSEKRPPFIVLRLCFSRYGTTVQDPAGCVFTEACQQTCRQRLPGGLFVSEATVSDIAHSKAPPISKNRIRYWWNRSPRSSWTTGFRMVKWSWAEISRWTGTFLRD